MHAHKLTHAYSSRKMLLHGNSVLQLRGDNNTAQSCTFAPQIELNTLKQTNIEVHTLVRQKFCLTVARSKCVRKRLPMIRNNAL